MTIAVYGATGHTGKLVLAELARRDLDAVLVGRNAERLRAAGSPVRQASLDNEAQLADAFRDCSVVINCVAPFTRYGAPVIRAAIAAGVHYLDIAGEQTYIKSVFDTFAAEATDVTVIPMVNDGGFLADLLVGMLASPDAQDVVVVHRFSDVELSRGSARTALANRDLFTSGGLTFVDGQWRSGAPQKHTEMTFPGEETPVPLVKFAMPEIATIPRHLPARHVEGLAEQALSTAFTALTEDMIESFPESPGHAGTFTLLADVDGRRGVVDGADTYGITAVTVVEAAHRLITTGAKPGVLAPAQAFDPADFLDSLASRGVRTQA
ncbi:saccharopine dehydrogenase NADP-binding domain-containing protein [Kibdelosporangium persicum]|uniref:Trans-acting enoyl reductase n=1 Tax=Kibdelosporangium persicum TaxID=2698649 RepID=A0ABX2FAX4_9PSEU|nr:saccharopine dehydrogenase NADP-binding domain-containing protein [Kibdelosporangium persicum]NRN68075.1 Trans-acting enoyl reductase [Kibdelosporangium persicum]